MNSFDKQDLLYAMLEKLKLMAAELPPKYQIRLPYDTLSSIAHLLMDNTVFEIVKELIDLQNMSEKHLYQQRIQIVARHKGERDNILGKQKEEVQRAECQGRKHVLVRLPLLHKHQLDKMSSDHEEELKAFDRRVLFTMDEKLTEQQSTLEQVGLPVFKMTQNPLEIQLQMFLIDFIVRLGNIDTYPRRP